MAFRLHIPLFLVLGAPLFAQKTYIPSDHAVLVVDTTSNTLIATVPTTATVSGSIAVSPDGSRAYAIVGADNDPSNNGHPITVIAIDSLTNAITSSVYFATAAYDVTCPENIAAHPDGKRVFITDPCKGAVFVVDVDARYVIATITLPQSALCCTVPTGIVVPPDGSMVYVAAFTGPNSTCAVYGIALSSNSLANTFPLPCVLPYGIATSPDGKTLYVAGGGGGLQVVNAQTGTLLAAIPSQPTGGGDYGVAVSTDGSTVYVSNFLSGIVQQIDALSHTVSGTITVGSSAYGLSLTPDGKELYVGTGAGEVVVDTVPNKVIATIPGGASGLGKFIQPSSCMKATTLAHVPGTDDTKRAVTGRIGVGEQVLLSLANGDVATWTSSSGHGTFSHSALGSKECSDQPISGDVIGAQVCFTAPFSGESTTINASEGTSVSCSLPLTTVQPTGLIFQRMQFPKNNPDFYLLFTLSDFNIQMESMVFVTPGDVSFANAFFTEEDVAPKKQTTFKSTNVLFDVANTRAWLLACDYDHDTTDKKKDPLDPKRAYWVYKRSEKEKGTPFSLVETEWSSSAAGFLSDVIFQKGQISALNERGSVLPTPNAPKAILELPAVPPVFYRNDLFIVGSNGCVNAARNQLTPVP